MGGQLRFDVSRERIDSLDTGDHVPAAEEDQTLHHGLAGLGAEQHASAAHASTGSSSSGGRRRSSGCGGEEEGGEGGRQGSGDGRVQVGDLDRFGV